MLISKGPIAARNGQRRRLGMVAVAMLAIPAQAMAQSANLDALYGSWHPVSNEFRTQGDLRVTEQSIFWAGCPSIPFRIISDRALDGYSGDAGYPTRAGAIWRAIAVELGDTSCIRKIMSWAKYIHFAMSPDYPEHADITFYGGLDDLEKGAVRSGIFRKNVAATTR